ncbi:hypothetical protein ABT095_26515 [Kitasatospora sp. NPDC002227]|uniref:hypothetical protein n=1 Tax=Kitasatospora sp. NPDC002227 TaxID=3154773 RepID=UPI0033246113
MTAADRLAEFLRTGRLGLLAVGASYAEVRAVLGSTELAIDGPDPVYKYAGVELYTDGATGLIRTVQLEPFGGVLRLPVELGLGDSLAVPADRDGLVELLDSQGLGHSLGEFHVPGQTDLMVHGSRVMAFCHENGELHSLAVSADRPRTPTA